MNAERSAPPKQTEVYSHGLEKIYQYEVVNPATVQPLISSSIIKQEKKVIEIPLSLQKAEQLFFDFGPQFATSLAALQLEEPLEGLGLSAFAYKAVASKNCKTVAELCMSLPHMSGIGQSHLDEIMEKIMQFVGPNPFRKRTQVNFLSLLRILLQKADSKERFILLEPHDLDFLFPLKPNEAHEVEKWGQETRQKIFQKIFDGNEKKNYLKTKLKEVGYAFILPWLHPRLGFAPHYELDEYLVMLSEDKEEKMLYNIKKIFEEILEIPSLFNLFLIEVAPGIYAQNSQIALLYNQVVGLAKSYFYTPFLSYPLSQLIRFIERDSAIMWEHYSHNFIEKILRLDPYFVIWRNEKGVLFIQL